MTTDTKERIAELENTNAELFAAISKLVVENAMLLEQIGDESTEESEAGIVVVGGPHDGQRIPPCYSDLRFLRLAVVPPPMPFIISTDVPTMPELREEDYVRTEFADRNGVDYVFVHPSVRHPMRELIHGYRRAVLKGRG
jgi:hypothetical protein